MTLEEFNERLRSKDPDVSAYFYGKLMRQAKPDDVFLFVDLAGIRKNWSNLQRHLGDKRAFWKWILEEWGVLEPYDE